MSLAGMNDRDNTSNENRFAELSSAYGMSNFKPKRKIVDKVGSPQTVLAYLYHKNGFPEAYAEEFRTSSEAFVKFVQREKKQNKLLTYNSIKEQADSYIEKVYGLTCEAYGLKSLEFSDFDRWGVVNACSEHTKRDALELLEDIFCSRGEALSALSEEEREILFAHSDVEYLYKHDSNECKAIMKEAKRDIKMWEKAFKEIDGDVPDSIRKLYEEKKSQYNSALAKLERIELGYKKYNEEVLPRVSKIWNKIRFYVPKES